MAPPRLFKHYRLPYELPFMASTLHIMSIADTVFVLATVQEMLCLQTTSGISVTATLMLALCAQSQITTMYYLFACPTYKRDGIVIPKPPQLMDYLNLAQLLMQWLCSLLILGFVLLVREVAPSNVETDPTTEATTEQPTTDRTSTSATTAVTLLSVHAALCIFWAILAGKPRDDWLDLPFVVIMSINYACINPLITIATGVAYWLQASATGASQNQTALSRTTLVLHIVTFSALAVLWLVRFRLPQRLRSSPQWLVFDWYPLVGWPCVNNALIGVGQCVVLHGVDGTARSGAQSMSPETQPLLA